MQKVDRLVILTTASRETLYDLDYSNKYDPQVIVTFFKLLADSDAPILENTDNIFCHAVDADVFIIVVSGANNVTASDKVELLFLLERLVKALTDFLGKLNVSNVITNIPLVAEIVDCFLIGGYPHLTTSDKIRGFLDNTYEDPSKRRNAGIPGMASAEPRHTPAGYKPATSQTVIARKHAHQSQTVDELFVDMIESVHIDKGDNSTHAAVVRGKLNVKNLTGGQKKATIHVTGDYGEIIPNFHGVVVSTQFTSSGRFTADIPLGTTTLMAYSRGIQHLPITVEARSIGDSDIEFTLSNDLPPGVMCIKVRLVYIVPDCVIGISKQLTLPSHSAEFDESSTTLIWSIPEIAGQTKAKAVFKIIPNRGSTVHLEEKLKIEVQFEISNHTCSGVRLQAFKVSSAQTNKKWIRHVCISHAYRLSVLRQTIKKQPK